MDTVIQALCSAVAVLLDAAEVALSGEHLEGALERVLQAEAVLHMAHDVGHSAGSIEEAALVALNERIERIAQRGAEAAEQQVQGCGADFNEAQAAAQLAEAALKGAQDLEDGFTAAQMRLEMEADVRASNDPSYTEDLT